jgi:CheY-like chemotaxis protein
MSGSISVESVFGKGSVFTISLPVKTKLQVNLNEHPHDLTVNFAKSLNILVVEDTVTNQMVIKLILEKLGHKVVTQNNGLEAVDYFKQNSEHIDLIFMDISMPVMDGLTATKQIRQFCSATPIIALTAHAMAKDKQTCIDAGMNAFVSKPIRSKEIQRTLKTVISV